MSMKRSLYSLMTLVSIGSLATGCAQSVVPKITQIVPPAACDSDSMRRFVLNGSDFLKGDPLPEVTFTRSDDATVMVKVTATSLDGCTDTLCTMLNVAVPQAQLPVGSYKVSVKNPCSGDCTSKEDGPPAIVDVVTPPQLTEATPKLVCAGSAVLSLKGSGFYDSASVLIDTVPAMSVMVASDKSSATARFSGPLTVSPIDSATGTPVPYDVTVRNAVGCEAVLKKAVVVTAGPSVLFVDPPAIPSGYSIQATAYGSGISAPVRSVQIAPAGSMNFMPITASSDPARPNRILLTLPGTLAAGSYDLMVQDQTECPALLPSAVKVVASPTLTLTTATPAFGSPAQNTAVSIAGTGFVSTPRAYLATNGGSAGTSAAALSAVTFRSGSSLTAVIPAGLAPGSYDLIVVNPDGSFGLKSKVFTVTQAAAPPPVVTSVAPSSVVESTTAPITILGTSFRSPQIAPTCYDGANQVLAGATASVSTSTAQSISATLTAPTGSFYCILRVTDPDNSTYFDFSAVGVTNASLNLRGFKTGSALGTARRALAAVSGRPTDVARFVYAIGGDKGADNMPLATVEAASVGLSGDLGQFAPVSQSLPTALSFLGAVNIGRFLYTVGGFDGTAAVTSVYRAELLDPLNAPQISDVDVRFDMAQGLDPGLYTYRVAAVMQSGDANNPGGETLAGDFFPVQLPQVMGGKLQLVLFWRQVAGAQGYRVYRSLKANDAAGTEALLATVSDSGLQTQSYIDNGSKTPAGAAPLPLGSIGAWKTLAPLTTARAGAGVVAAPDPTKSDTFYLYAMGGNSGTPSAPILRASVEYMTITLMNNGAQQMTGTWAATASSLPSARWLLPGLLGTNAQNSVVPAGQSFIYASTGLASNLTTGTLDRPVYYAQIGANGQPVAFANSGSVGVGRSGFGAALVNNQMMAFGGFQLNIASNASDSAKLTSPTALANFNALGGGTLLAPRALQGTAIESAFIYQLGGVNALGTALGTSEQTIW
ncbi:MAG: hypothetical protein U1A78_34185 [Polyangia bacterium]